MSCWSRYITLCSKVVIFPPYLFRSSSVSVRETPLWLHFLSLVLFLFAPHCCCNPPSMLSVACQLHGFLLEPHPLCVCVCVRESVYVCERERERVGVDQNRLFSYKWWGERSLHMHVVQIASGKPAAVNLTLLETALWPLHNVQVQQNFRIMFVLLVI